MIAPLLISLLYREPARYPLSFLASIALVFAIGFAVSRKKPVKDDLYAKEGFIIVALSWILLSFFGSFPYVLSGDIPSLIDAFFETASGFTTTGASILADVTVLSRSTLFWRSFAQFIGGLGVLVFVLAILPKTESESVHIMKAEVPGPTFGKLVSRLSSSARILYIIYIAMTVLIVFFLWLGGPSLFESILLGFGAAGTGGFSIRNGSVSVYDSAYIEMVLSIGMLLSSLNFNLYFMTWTGLGKEALKSEELKWYLGILTGSIILVAMNLISINQEVGLAFRDSIFTTISFVTTSGFSTVNFGNWPLFSQLILIALMFMGGMSGSTSGGLKVSRIVILLKVAWAELKRTSHPNRVVSIQFEEKPIEENITKSILRYILVFLLVFAAVLLVVSLESPDFASAFGTVTATLNNIGFGPGLIGPESSYAFYSPLTKLFLSFVMIMGRLEIFPMLILFSPSIWRRKA